MHVPVLTGGQIRLELIATVAANVDKWLAWSKSERNKCGFFHVQITATDRGFAEVAIILEELRARGCTEIQHSSFACGTTPQRVLLIMVTFSLVLPAEAPS